MNQNGLTQESWCILGLVLAPVITLGIVLLGILCCNCGCPYEEEALPRAINPSLVPTNKKRSSSVRFLDRLDSEKTIVQSGNETHV